MFYKTYIKKGSTDIKDVRRAGLIERGKDAPARNITLKFGDWLIEHADINDPTKAAYTTMSSLDFVNAYEPFDASGCLGCGPGSERFTTNINL